MSVIKRTDANQKIIVAALRAAGASVAITSSLGKGFVDIVAGINGFSLLMEIKDGSKARSQQKLTEAEQKFFDEWKGHAAIVTTIDEALSEIEKYRVRKNEHG